MVFRNNNLEPFLVPAEYFQGLREVYGDGNPPGMEEGEVPALLPQALPLHAYVQVDYYIPGCPPDSDRIWKFLSTLLKEGKPRLEGEEIRFG